MLLKLLNIIKPTFYIVYTYSYTVYWTIKNTFKIFGPGTWCTKKPFGYWVVHHGYLLTSCPGQEFTFV